LQPYDEHYQNSDKTPSTQSHRQSFPSTFVRTDPHPELLHSSSSHILSESRKSQRIAALSEASQEDLEDNSITSDIAACVDNHSFDSDSDSNSSIVHAVNSSA
jgi:hypothetical protein